MLEEYVEQIRNTSLVEPEEFMRRIAEGELHVLEHLNNNPLNQMELLLGYCCGICSHLDEVRETYPENYTAICNVLNQAIRKKLGGERDGFGTINAINGISQE